MLDGEHAIAERLDQDRDLGDGEHAALAGDVMGLGLGAHQRHDLAGRRQHDADQQRQLRPAEAIRDRAPGGLVLVWKRFEEGAFKWPPIMDGVMRLSPAQLAALIEGV